ncbi:DgyrCDS11278 [Dimorphilus gyrociliatus]|nr:DgyrCDS11278 [Dimorphilus gyrociliatus]
MTPLGLAAFWGYSDIVSLLLQSNADINGTNAGTNWTPLHCAAFQDHGKVIMKLMEYNPRVDIRDHQGRTAVDFASALDSIWPFFAARNCKRTHKSELLRMNIITKLSSQEEEAVPSNQQTYFSRPGSAYVFRDPLSGEARRYNKNQEAAAMTGDVLADINEGVGEIQRETQRLKIWSN